MGSGTSGLYSGTNSSNSSSSSGGLSKPNESSKPLYKATKKLVDHIEKAQPSKSGSNGIKGAHNKTNFLNEVDKVGAKVVSTSPSSQIDGVEKITYKMPKKDKTGKITGEYKSKNYEKTVYNPSKISTDKYVQLGLQAANNAAKSTKTGRLGREWSGTDNQGNKWHGYCNKDGEIISFYPED